MRRSVRAVCITSICAAMMPSPSAAKFTAMDLAVEEAKFAAYSVKNGMRAAFLEFFADQSWLLRPDLVDATAWLLARPDPPIVLDWKSLRTILSASGDLGFSTGPWIRRSKANPNAAAAHGQFFSVWQKQKNGEWKVLIDHGISHEASATPDALPTKPLVGLALAKLKADVLVYDAEKDFVHRTMSLDSQYAYIDRITNRTVLLRDGQFPIEGKAAVMKYVNSQEGTWTWTPKLKGASSANDLAYVVGNVTGETQSGESRNGHYIRVWVRDASGEAPTRWTIAAEILTLEPQGKL